MDKHRPLPDPMFPESVFHYVTADRTSAWHEVMGRPGNNVMIANLNAMILQRGSAAVALCSCPQAELAGPRHSPIIHTSSQEYGHSAWADTTQYPN